MGLAADRRWRRAGAAGCGAGAGNSLRTMTRNASRGASVTSISISVAVGILTFGCGILGLLLQRLLPEQHMSSGSRDMIGAVIGLITLLLALVLGTLVGSAYGFYATQKSEVETLAARAIELDMALEQYGPETRLMRAGMKIAMTRAYHTFWQGGDADPKELAVEAGLPALKAMTAAVGALDPQTPIQKQLISTIGFDSGFILQTRLLMSLQLASPVSWPLLIVVVSWALLLFFGFGVLSRLNATSLAALGLGAFAVASAVFLILELNAPYTSLFRLPAAPIEQALKALG